jgi:predicted methyltransferase
MRMHPNVLANYEEAIITALSKRNYLTLPDLFAAVKERVSVPVIVSEVSSVLSTFERRGLIRSSEGGTRFCLTEIGKDLVAVKNIGGVL